MIHRSIQEEPAENPAEGLATGPAEGLATGLIKEPAPTGKPVEWARYIRTWEPKTAAPQEDALPEDGSPEGTRSERRFPRAARIVVAILLTVGALAAVLISRWPALRARWESRAAAETDPSHMEAVPESSREETEEESGASSEGTPPEADPSQGTATAEANPPGEAETPSVADLSEPETASIREWVYLQQIPESDPNAPDHHFDPLETRYFYGKLATPRTNQTAEDSPRRCLSESFKELLDSYALQWLLAPENQDSLLDTMRLFRFRWPDEEQLALYRLEGAAATLLECEGSDFEAILRQLEAANSATSDYLFLAVYRDAAGHGRIYLLRGAIC